MLECTFHSQLTTLTANEVNSRFYTEPAVYYIMSGITAQIGVPYSAGLSVERSHLDRLRPQPGLNGRNSDRYTVSGRAGSTCHTKAFVRAVLPGQPSLDTLPVLGSIFC